MKTQNPSASASALRKKPLTTKAAVIAVSLVVLGAIGLADYSSGREMSFGVFYFLPIWLITWHFNRKGGILMALICAVVWFVVDDAGSDYSKPFFAFWNAGVRLAYFLTFALLLSHAGEQLHQSRREVNQLSSLLPICATCKKIRDENGAWQEFETYIRDPSATKFSHGVCPECAQKLYPEFSDELLKKWKQEGG